MQGRSRSKQRIGSIGLWLTLVIVLGIAFRFAHPGYRLCTLDESFTLLRISGYTEAEVVQDLSRVRAIDFGYLQKYQQINPDRSVQGTLQGLAAEEPQVTPLYYVAARYWAMGFGSSLAALRTLSALFSLLALPVLYWLCLELFASHQTARLAVALMAASPFHLLFANDARHYSLWALTLLLSSASLLRALRLNTAASWMLYACSLTASLYACLLSLLMAIGQLLYVFCISGVLFWQVGRSIKVLQAFSLSAGLSLLAFLPWLRLLWINWQRFEATTGKFSQPRLALLDWLQRWLQQPGRLLFDFNLGWAGPLPLQLIQHSFTGLLLLLIGYAGYWLWRTTPLRVWLFVYTLVGSTTVGLLLQDGLIGAQGGWASAKTRYLAPCMIGFGLAIAHLLVDKARQQPRLWQGILAGVVTMSLASSTALTIAPFWWLNGSPATIRDFGVAAALVNQSPHPLTISDTQSWDLLFFSHWVKPETMLLAQPRCYSCALPPRSFLPAIDRASQGYSNVFLFPNPSATLQRWARQQGYRLEVPTIVHPSPLVKLVSPEQGAAAQSRAGRN